jgi:HTH-type transcriptional regulator/antitoxin PezA
MTIDMKDVSVVGRNIKKVRLFREINQSGLAKSVGVSRITLSRYENGLSPVPVRLLELFAEQLDIPMIILFEKEIFVR